MSQNYDSDEQDSEEDWKEEAEISNEKGHQPLLSLSLSSFSLLVEPSPPLQDLYELKAE